MSEKANANCNGKAGISDCGFVCEKANLCLKKQICVFKNKCECVRNREANAPFDFLFARSACVCADGFDGAVCSGKTAGGSSTGTSIFAATTPCLYGFNTLYHNLVLLCCMRFCAIGVTTTFLRKTLLFLFVSAFLIVILDLPTATTTPVSDL